MLVWALARSSFVSACLMRSGETETCEATMRRSNHLLKEINIYCSVKFTKIKKIITNLDQKRTEEKSAY